MSRLRLLKLLYIADRESLKETGRTITADRAVAMEHGPVLSRTYNLIKGEDAGSCEWSPYIVNISPLELELRQPPGNGLLSVAEIKRLRCVVERFERLDDWSVANYTHTFPEWQKNQPTEERKSRPIPLDDVLEAVGLLDAKESLLAEENAIRAFDDLLATVA